MQPTNLRALWTATLGDFRWIWLLLILPVALLLPALPIDETRYLGVAWEMRIHGDFLVPHLNGATYADKPPLLFWLINIAWTVFGLNVWSVRLGVLAASLATVIMFERLMLRLDADAITARRAAFILMGMVYFALFSSAIMFDVLLTTWVLLALHGAVDLDRRRWLRGIVLLSIAFGLGILTKGPVILLDAAMVVVFGPWWSETARRVESALVRQSRPRHSRRCRDCAGLGDSRRDFRRPGLFQRDLFSPDARPRDQELRASASVLVLFCRGSIHGAAVDFRHARALASLARQFPHIQKYTIRGRVGIAGVRCVLPGQREAAALPLAAARRARRVSGHGTRPRRFARRWPAVRPGSDVGRYRPCGIAADRRPRRRRRLLPAPDSPQ